MTIDTYERAQIIARGEQGRRKGDTDNERNLGRDVERLLKELDEANKRCMDQDSKISDLEEQLKELKQEP